MIESWDILVKSMSVGSKKAYSLIFKEFYTPLVLYARRYVADEDAAEDLVQGVFCHFWEDRKHWENVSFSKSYLYTAVRNRVLNYLRDNRNVSIEGVDRMQEDDFLLEMMEEEVYRELHAAIQLLPEKCRLIFLMKLEGNENQEIAARLKITEETVRSQIRRGKGILQKSLSGLMVMAIVHSIFG